MNYVALGLVDMSMGRVEASTLLACECPIIACMDFTIAIVDDLEEDRTHLDACVKHYFATLINQQSQAIQNVRVQMFASAEDFLPVFTPGAYDLVFLDICMNEMNGIELARELRADDTSVLIVFQTTAAEYAFDAFPLHPFDYLIKPCSQEAVDNVLEEALRVLEVGDPEIQVSAVRATFSVPLRSIVAIMSSGHNTELLLTNNQHLVSTESFKSIGAKIEGDARFLTINRGITINMDHVLAPEGDNMRMKDGSRYPIRVNGRAGVLSTFSQYMISKVSKRG